MYPSNEFINYIFKRIQNKNYRGIHLSQHNRLPFDKVLQILRIIYRFSWNNKFKIHIGDWKGNKQNGCGTYYKIVDKLKETIEQGSYNSLKKNIFPDLDTMGFLNRYNKNGILISKDKREPVHKVSLTDFAVNYIKENSIRKQYKMYFKATERLLEPILDELFLLLYKIFETISVYEYMFILSDENLDINSKKSLVKEYRKLRKTQQIKIKQDIQTKFIEINKVAKNKSYKRDFGNWYNESLQIFNLLNQTVYFKTFRKTVLMLSISQEALEFSAKRSQKQREKYFEWHNVQGNKKYQLHHIFPLDYTTTRRDLKLIDNYKNFIYISNKIHPNIPHTNNLYIKLMKERDNILLINPYNKEDYIDITSDIIINNNNLDKMIRYNKNLLEKIG